MNQQKIVVPTSAEMLMKQQEYAKNQEKHMPLVLTRPWTAKPKIKRKNLTSSKKKIVLV